MTSWTVELSEVAKKDLGQLAGLLRRRIAKRLLKLEQDPYALSAKKLKGAAGKFRLRVGDYRVVYRVDEARRVVDVERIRHRSAAYRGL